MSRRMCGKLKDALPLTNGEGVPEAMIVVRAAP
jgi:hypothetical protein